MKNILISGLKLIKYYTWYPSYHYDVCQCGHVRRNHGLMYLIFTQPNNACFDKIDQAYTADSPNFCRCMEFKMDNLKSLESRYARRSLWKKLLVF